VRIGIDTSGKFSTGPGFKSTVVAAAAGTDDAFDEIAAWTVAALRRWGIADRLDELHAKKLRAHEKLQVCEMLADRGDVRLAALATDPGLLRSADAVAGHRRPQRDKVWSSRAHTADGCQRRDDALALLDDPALHDDEYLLAACLPLILSAITQRAIGFFQHDTWRRDMASFVVCVDEETGPTIRYTGNALLPTLGGDERFSFRFPQGWRAPPVHPLLQRITHPDGDGIRPQALFDDVRWVSSHSEPAVQIADVVALGTCPANRPPR
jgi:hypothetical protein